VVGGGADRAAKETPDVTLRSSPETVIWAFITADIPPAATIKSGDTVKIDYRLPPGLLSNEDPVALEQLRPARGRAAAAADRAGAEGHQVRTAIEASLTATLQFIVHKGEGKFMRWPRAEDATHYYTMGMDLNLDVAMRHASQETVNFL
jgi:acetamidase/formamidase